MDPYKCGPSLFKQHANPRNSQKKSEANAMEYDERDGRDLISCNALSKWSINPCQRYCILAVSDSMEGENRRSRSSQFLLPPLSLLVPTISCTAHCLGYGREKEKKNRWRLQAHRAIKNTIEPAQPANWWWWIRTALCHGSINGARRLHGGSGQEPKWLTPLPY